MNWVIETKIERPGQIEFLAVKDGTRLRTVSWPSEEGCRGIIVLVNGHREYIEKYFEFISDFLKRGFAVYALDNRGQGMSDRPLPDRTKSYIKNFDYFSNDLNEYVTKIVMNDPRAKELPLYLVGHSMGGHICLRYLHDFPGYVSKAFLISPMIEMNFGEGIVKSLLQGLVRFSCRMGLGKMFAPGQGHFFTKESSVLRQRLLTHDNKRYLEETDILESLPDLYVGGATYGWLGAALDSIEKINEDGFLEQINIPVMAALAGDDKLVVSQSAQRLLSCHENMDVVTIKNSRHEIYRESDEYRNQLWQKIDGFLGGK